MHPELTSRLRRLEDDLRAGVIDRAALFWLKVFVDQAAENNGQIRSDRWVEAGLAAAPDMPGLAAAALAPRKQLVAGYDLFRFERLKDSAQFSGEALADLDWQRKYRVSLLAEFAADLPALQGWTEALWAELGGVAPQFAALEAVLARLSSPSPSEGEGRGGGGNALSDIVQQVRGGNALSDIVQQGGGGNALSDIVQQGGGGNALSDIVQQVRGGNALSDIVQQVRGGDSRSYLLEILHEAQAIFAGWLPRPAVERIAEALRIPQAEIYGVTEFYDLFHTEPVGRKIIRVCQDGPCGLAGSDQVMAALQARLKIGPHETSADGEYTLESVRCLGLCDRAPAVLVNLERHAPARVNDLEGLLSGLAELEKLRIGGMVKLALSNVGVVDPSSLRDYRAQGGLAALRKALHEMTPGQVLQAVKESKLVGRGGAAFPTGLKWQFAAENPKPRYVICNADESEPGAFKDRVLMDGDPFRVVEGLILACYAVEAERGFIYVRGEHRLGYERFSNAVRKLEEAGWLGEDIQGSGFSLHIEVRRGAGAYVCGEETALMESIEGKRGFPRLRPPFPTTSGLWGQPTVINNVETLAKVPPIVIHGPRWYNALGTPESAGTKLFAVSGSVLRPGVYEVPFGVPLRHLIYDLAGGLREGRTIQAVLTGGAAGTFLTAEHLDIPLTFEDFKKAGGTIGAGTIMVFDDTVDLRGVLARIGAFFAHESCGKCYPCQIGTQRQAEILRRVADGRVRSQDAATLLELGKVMTDTSICGLGQAASWAIVDAHRRWPGLFEPARIED